MRWEQVAEGAQVHSDDAAGYADMEEFEREAVRHSQGECVRGEAHTHGMESLWSVFKRGLHGTYHHVSPQHLGRHADEFAGRHNARDCDTAEQMERMARGMQGRTLTYRQLIGKVSTEASGASAPAEASEASAPQ